MTETATISNSYRASFEQATRAGLHSQPEAVHRLRREAIERFLQLGFPTTRLEAWRNTSVEPIAATEFHRLTDGNLVDPQVVAPFTLPGSLRVAVSGGRFAPELASLGGLPEGVEVRGLAEALEHIPEQVLPHLGRYADFQEQAFVALNTAFLSDGVFIQVPEGALLERPIHVIYLSAPATANCQLPTANHPRTLVVAGENSRLTVVEHYVGLPSGASQTERSAGPIFTNAVTETVAGAGSIIDHIRVQQEPGDTYHIATAQTHQEAASRVALHAFTVGGGLVRNDVNAVLQGEGAEVALNGLYLVKGNQHVDNHTRIDHAAPHCTSTETYKGIMDDQGRAVFNGRIVVHPDAQQTNAAQSNKNLMLSDKALVNTNPQLEIYADDVKCTHGSTVGQIDEEAMFYFLSRGIDRRTARGLLLQGFTQELISMIENETIRRAVNDLVALWLPNGQIPLGAG